MKTRNIYYNPNPLKKETSDCVVRAMCKAFDKEWDTMYLKLFKLGLELKVMPNSDEAWKEFLKRSNFIQHKVTNKKGSKRPTVESFAKEHKKGTYVLNLANHIVTCKDGHYYDLWDCGEKSLYGFWEKGEE